MDLTYEKEKYSSESHQKNGNPLWFKDAVIYELHVRAFRDSNGDGIGDFIGLTEKLDYLQGLGITAVWLLPFYPSPLKDDGYDIADYLNVNSDYGTLKDFKSFLKEAHKRDIKVIAELVLNHTSAEHLWFQRAKRAPKDSKIRDMYVWSDSPEKYSDARIIFKDFETSNWSWDSEAQSYFWHRFYSHQPDLNFENDAVQKALFRVIDFWFAMGVDGLRLDAVPYLFEKDGTNCENLPETHQFLKKLRSHIDKHFSDKMLIAEANQWPEDAVAYFGKGDECHMAFHFPLMPRMFMAIQMEDHFPIVDIIKSTPTIPENCQWATFLRNHDELTLEMVTDEERDYMYRVYAKDTRAKINLGIRRRMAPLLSNNRRKIELMNILLFTLPGTPIIYYGDEIGMGDNFYLGDRNGVRTPMQWSSNKNAGFSETNPHKMFLPIIIDPEYHFETINVQNQETSYSSLLWWIKNLITVRKRHKAFSRGSFELIHVDNSKILAFTRKYENEVLLVVVNLSRYTQVACLTMAHYAGMIPEEIYGKSKLPEIHDDPYTVTIGPYDFYWFQLKKITMESENMVTEIKLYTEGNWENVLKDKSLRDLENKVLPVYLKQSRWFGSKARVINRTTVIEAIPVIENEMSAFMVLIRVEFSEGNDEYYLLPLSFIEIDKSGITEDISKFKIAHLTVDNKEGILVDGTYDKRLHSSLFKMITSRKKIRGVNGELSGISGKRILHKINEMNYVPEHTRALKVEQSNSSILFDDFLFLKLYRKLDDGVNPELEVIKFIDEKTEFNNIPPFAGAIEYTNNKNENFTIALMQEYVENSGNAWSYVSEAISRYYDAILANNISGIEHGSNKNVTNDFTIESNEMQEILDEFFIEMIKLLGRRTAELHCALSTNTESAEFNPEPFSQLYQRSLYQSMQGLVQKTFHTLRSKITDVSDVFKKDIKEIINSEKDILEVMRKIVAKKIDASKIRIHGDYHLGQVLFTGKDFIILDFEGEPARPLSERKLKRSPFRDVAGMIRSFHYAAYSPLIVNSSYRISEIKFLERYIEPWYKKVSAVYIDSYLETAGNADFIPENKGDISILLKAFLMEKAVYELGYEINNRPDWLKIPMFGIKSMLINN